MIINQNDLQWPQVIININPSLSKFNLSNILEISSLDFLIIQKKMEALLESILT